MRCSRRQSFKKSLRVCVVSVLRALRVRLWHQTLSASTSVIAEMWWPQWPSRKKPALQCSGDWLQYGDSRSASTFQWWLVCSALRICALRHGRTDVFCNGRRGNSSYATVGKVHDLPANRRGNSGRVFRSAMRAERDESWAHVQIYSELASHGVLHEAALVANSASTAPSESSFSTT